MEEKFVQKTLELDAENSTGKIKVEKLCELIENHPYKIEVFKVFDIEKIKDEIISIDFIDTLFNRVEFFNKNYKRHSILAETKDINVFEELQIIDGRKDKVVVFEFEEYVVIDELKQGLKTIAKYDSKNTFLDDYLMTKYANNLFKIGLSDLARQNVQYFKDLANSSDNYNKHKSYRLVENDGITYLRGITSINKYFEYGVDFTFVVSMLLFHNNMKKNKGTEYSIQSAALNESKLEIIVAEKFFKDAGSFGQVSTAIKVTTNDLGQGSLNFRSIIHVGKVNEQGFYLFPKDSKVEPNKLVISHTTKPENVFASLQDIGSVLNTSGNFIKELHQVKSIKSPDELRIKIKAKVDHPRSSFSHIKKLSDIFKTKIDNDITHFSKLLQMCNKAEELDIDYDLKDKLRYLISDIILYGNSQS
jgi:hypothetical protein